MKQERKLRGRRNENFDIGRLQLSYTHPARLYRVEKPLLIASEHNFRFADSTVWVTDCVTLWRRLMYLYIDIIYYNINTIRQRPRAIFFTCAANSIIIFKWILRTYADIFSVQARIRYPVLRNYTSECLYVDMLLYLLLL